MNKQFLLVALVLLLFVCQAASARAPLTFEERVKAQEAIERVYYNHRIWPKENPTPKPPFEQMVSRAMLEAKVTDYLKKSTALGEFWQRPIQPEQLQAEMDRMAKGTKDPATLKELYAELNNDPYVIAECLARPILADRLIRNWYANDERFHADTKAKAEAALASASGGSLSLCHGGNYQQVTYVRSNPAQGDMNQEAKINRGEIVLDAKRFEKEVHASPDIGNSTVLRETPDTFGLIRTTQRTQDRIDVETLTFPKLNIGDWLITTEMECVLEPASTAKFAFAMPLFPRTSCTPDSWNATSSTDPNCPSGRCHHTAVWTGIEMIVWGGSDGNYSNTGGAYTASTDSWTPTSIGESCPSGRAWHIAIWTGKEMIVWGGSINGYQQNTGGLYNPSTDSWIPTSTGANCPLGRYYPTAVWTGKEMIVWGGSYTDGTDSFTGARYDPSNDTWTSTSVGANCPSARHHHTAVWTGTEMIIWGGFYYDGTNFCYFNTGGCYNPSSDSWMPTSIGAGCPSGRLWHVAVWTGSEMIIWGGDSDGALTTTGGRYNPSSDIWQSTSTGTNCPYLGFGFTAVWTGTEMIVWGGGYYTNIWNYFNMGGQYNPLSDSWMPTSRGVNCPSPRQYHTAILAETRMIIWGGLYIDYSKSTPHLFNTGGSYAPSGPMPETPPAPTFTTVESTSLTVNWAAVTGAASYDVWRAVGDICAGAVKITSVPITDVFYADTGISPCTQYSYYIVANYGCGPSDNGDCASVTTSAQIPAAPAAPTFSFLSCTTLTVNWAEVTGATGYDVWRASGASCSGVVKITASPVSGTTFNDSGLTSLAQYSYFVVASNNCGSSANGVCASVTTTALPAVPAGVSAVGTCGGVTVSWAPSSGATSYNVMRGTVCGSAVTTFTNSTSLLSDTTAVAGTNYQYWVVSVNSCGASQNSICASATRLGVPAAPASPTFTAVGCAGLTVNWASAAGATSYDVLRAVGATCGGAVKINGAPMTGTSYNDGSLVSGTQYSYFITANNDCGASGNGGCAWVTATAVPSPTISGSSANVCPTPYVTLTASAGYAGYQWNFNGVPICGATQSTYNVSLSGSYSVTATDANGCVGTSAQKAVTETYCATAEVSPAEAPVPLRFVKDASSPMGYYLHFQKAASATGYNIYEGNIGTWYSHANAAGNFCHATVTDLGTGEMRAAITPSSDGRYYLVTAYRVTREGPSGYASSGTEIPASQSTCSP